MTWQEQEEAFQNEMYLQILQKIHGSDALTPEQKRELTTKSQEKFTKAAVTTLIAIAIFVVLSIGVVWLLA